MLLIEPKTAMKPGQKPRLRRYLCPSSFLLVNLWLIFLGKNLLSAPETAKNFELGNGLKVFLLEKRGLPIVNVVVAVNMGTKDETKETSGLVHILEHCILFRGTELHPGYEISREARRHGAYFNAHTGQDLAFFEISVPSEQSDFALQNQKEILFSLDLKQDELEKEKNIILEELNQLEDDPAAYATALVYQNLFRGHPYANPLRGNRDAIKALTVDKVEELYRRYFHPANCALAVVGDFGIKSMEENVRSVFGVIEGQRLETADFEMVRPPEKDMELEIEMDVSKAYLVIGVAVPDYNHPDQYAIDVLTEVFGRNVNPMLNSVLRGKRHLVETISMTYHALRYGGVILITLTLDPKNIASAKRETLNFLRRARGENYSPEDFIGEEQFYAYDFLGGAKSAIRFSAYQSRERGLALAASLAQHLLISTAQENRPYLESIDKLRSSDLRQAAAKYFSRGKYVSASVVPKKRAKPGDKKA